MISMHTYKSELLNNTIQLFLVTIFQDKVLSKMSPTFILEGVLLFIIGLVGIGGNTAAIFVFSRKRRIQRNFHALMLSLSIFDMVSSLIDSILESEFLHFLLLPSNSCINPGLNKSQNSLVEVLFYN